MSAWNNYIYPPILLKIISSFMFLVYLITISRNNRLSFTICTVILTSMKSESF